MDKENCGRPLWNNYCCYKSDMKQLIYIVFTVIFLIYGCGTSQRTVTNKDIQKEPPVRIANDSLQYEIIIIDPGFTQYLHSIAKPISYYSKNYLEVIMYQNGIIELEILHNTILLSMKIVLTTNPI